MSEMKIYVGSRIPTLGIPVVVVGYKDEIGENALKFEAHLFFDGRTKCYHAATLQSIYGENNDKIGDYIAVVEKMIDDEMERIILEEMSDRGIPAHLYSKLAPCEPSEFTRILYSLCSRGYDEEFDKIAHSNIGKLSTEFSGIMELPQIKVTISTSR